MNEIFAALGIHPQDLMAGFLGGLSRILMPPYMGAWSSLSTVILGAVTSAYCTDLVAGMIGDKVPRGFVGWAVGLAAMALCHGVIGAIGNLKFPGGRQDAA